MSDTADNDYEKLSKEEKEARDKADRAREVAEQAGKDHFVDLALDFTILRFSATVFLDPGIRRSRCCNPGSKRDACSRPYRCHRQEETQRWFERSRTYNER